MGDTRAAVTVTIKTCDGRWERIGTGSAPGIEPEGVSLSTNEGGPDTCSFTLRRSASNPWPDLLAFNQAEVWVGGTPVWGGRIHEAPISDQAENMIAVQGRGWQYHLDDDLLTRMYVMTDMSRYVNARDKPAAVLGAGTLPADSAVGVGSGVITVGVPNGFAVVNGDAAAVVFDAGASVIGRVVVAWELTSNLDAGNTLYSRTGTSEYPLGGTVDDSSVVLNGATSGTLSLTPAAPRRYHHIFWYRNGGAGTFAADQNVRITSVKLFSSTSYESGGASVLKASQVVTDVLASGALPLLSTSTSRIETTSFSIPEFAPQGYQTPRALISAANAYEGNVFGVNERRELFYKERITTPTLEIGAWSGADFQDASTNSAESLYNKVIVQGTGPDGAQISETRTATVSLLSRQGFTRTAVLTAGAPLTTTSAQQLGDIWLAEKSSPPFKGSITVTGQGGCRRISGGGIHASELLLHVGERIRVGTLVDPSNGGWGRDGTIKSVSYSHDTETATVELDNERGRLEALLARLEVVTSQIRT